MCRELRSVKKTIQVLTFVRESRNIKAAARHIWTGLTVVQLSQRRKLVKREYFLMKNMTSNCKTSSNHSGSSVEHENLGWEVFDCVTKQNEAGVPVSTYAMIAKFFAINSSFKERDRRKLQQWVCNFMTLRKLSSRLVTRTGQKLNKNLFSVREGFSEALRIKFKPEREYETSSFLRFMTIDKTAVFFDANQKSTVHDIGDRTVSVSCTGSSCERLANCVSAACEGAKFSLLAILEDQPNGKREKNLRNVFPQNMYGFC